MTARPDPVRLIGTLSVEREPVSAGEVLAFTSDPPRFIARANTDRGGNFVLLLEPGLSASVDLLGRAVDGMLTVTGQSIQLPPRGPVELTAPAPVTLEVEIESAAGFPAELSVFMDPVAVDELPERLAPFVTQRAEGVFGAHFAELSVGQRAFSVRVQPGTWTIGGSHIVYERPNSSAPTFKNFIVASARAPEGEPFAGTESSGFAVEVTEDQRIVLRLREMADEEL